MTRYLAKVHYQSTPFTMTYTKAYCELDEEGKPKQDAENVYLEGIGAIGRKTIKSIDITPVEE
jgi:hypothetical protein